MTLGGIALIIYSRIGILKKFSVRSNGFAGVSLVVNGDVDVSSLVLFRLVKRIVLFDTEVDSEVELVVSSASAIGDLFFLTHILLALCEFCIFFFLKI